MLTARTEASALAKVSFKGDTKRIKLNGDWDELVTRTRASFSDIPEGPLKFFYVDEESDLISVTSQADLSEALDRSNAVKLTVAETTSEAQDEILERNQSAAFVNCENEIDDALSEAFSLIDTSEKEDVKPVAVEEKKSEDLHSEEELAMIRNALAKAQDRSTAEAMQLAQYNKDCPVTVPKIDLTAMTQSQVAVGSLADSQIARNIQHQIWGEEKKQAPKAETVEPVQEPVKELVEEEEVPVTESQLTEIKAALVQGDDKAMAEEMQMAWYNKDCSASKAQPVDADSLTVSKVAVATLADSQVARNLQHQVWSNQLAHSSVQPIEENEEVKTEEVASTLTVEEQQLVGSEVRAAFDAKFAHVFDPELDEELEAEENQKQIKAFNNRVYQMFGAILGQAPKTEDDLSDEDEDSDEDYEFDEATQKLVASEVSKLLSAKVEEFFMPLAKEAIAKQEDTVHEGVICDGCKAFPVRGIRYKCTVCGDFDICQTCESMDVHPEHVLCKIRKPSQAPVKLVCQYTGHKSSLEDTLFQLSQMGAPTNGQVEE